MTGILPDNFREWCNENSGNIYQQLFGTSEMYVKSIAFTTNTWSVKYEISLHDLSKAQMEDILKVVRSWQNMG